MIAASASLLLAGALLLQDAQPVDDSEPPQETAHIDEDGAFGWGCWVPVAIGAYKGTVSRAYFRKRSSVYTMQIELRGSHRHSLIWAIDPRPGSSARLRAWPHSRREADAFRFGPGHVLVDLKPDSEVAVVGGLWIQYWGDGVYAGADMWASQRKAPRRMGGPGQLAGIGALVSPVLIAKLTPARTWTAVLTDSTGRRLATDIFEVPPPQEAESTFRQARAAIDALEPRFRIDHSPLSEGGAHCSDNNDPIADI
jgi:hypothetical protein